MAKDAKPAEAVAPAGGGNKKMMMIIIGVVALVLVGGAAAGYFLFMKGGEEHAPAEKGGKKAEKGGKKGEHKEVYVTIDAFVVNIRGAEDENHYLQLAFDMKVDSPAMQDEVKQKMPEIRNKVLMHLSGKTVNDLGGPDGKQKLSEELKEQINGVLGYKKDDGVLDVLFTSFVIQ